MVGDDVTANASAGPGPRPRKDPLGTFGDFVPWVLYWALVGNVSFRTSLLIALAAAAAVLVLHRLTDRAWRTLPVGSFVVFLVLAVLAFVVSDDFLERWIQPLSNLGLLLIVAGGMVVGRPFTLDYAKDGVSPEMARSKGFLWMNQRFTAVWVVAFGIMTVSSFVPPLVEGDATMKDGGSTLSIVGYWVVPFVALGLAALIQVVLVRGLGDGPIADHEATGSGLPGGADQPSAAGLDLDVAPTSLADAPLPIRVGGVDAGEQVEVRLTLADALNRRFVSHATFTATADGVDTGRDAPSVGPWSTADATAPIWSATWGEDGPADLFLPPWGPARGLVEVTAGATTLRRTVVRLGLADGVRPVEIAQDGVVGRLFVPAGAGPFPGVVLVGGSEGGIDSLSSTAGLLASHGIEALVVGLFGADGLPAVLDSVPLEPIVAGAALLRARSEVDPRSVSLLGLSRGAEAVLSAAAHVPEVDPAVVVGLSPGSVVWEALDDEGQGTGRSSWTVGGAPLPYVSVDDVAISRDLLSQAFRRGLHPHLPQHMHLRQGYVGGLARPEAAAAAIPVERIGARLVLHAGGADALWPSDEMAAAIVARRRDAGRDDDSSTVHPDAGHLLRFPVVPVQPAELDGLVFGGQPAGQAAAHAAIGDDLVRVLGGRPA